MKEGLRCANCAGLSNNSDLCQATALMVVMMLSKVVHFALRALTPQTNVSR